MHFESKKIFLKRYIIIAACFTGLIGCGLNNKDTLGTNGGVNGDDVPADLVGETLNLKAGSQLFAFKASGGSDSTNFAVTAKSDVTTDATATAKDGDEQLYIVDDNGKAKRFLSNHSVDRFHLIRDGQNSAYLVRIKFKSNFKGNRWFILRSGKKAIQVSQTKDRESLSFLGSDFKGQLEAKGWLAFSDGNLVDLDGNQQEFAKNIKKATKVMHISGNIVALKRELRGKEITTLVDTESHIRKSYKSYFAPNFVQIKNDGDGLLSDSDKSLWSGSALVTQISSFGQEIALDGDDQDRSPAYDRTDTNGCVWFNGSIKIPKQEAALLICYVSKTTSYTSDYYLTWVEPQGAGWKFTDLYKLSSSSAIESLWKSPFIQGETFTIVDLGANFLLVDHAAKTATELKTKFSTLFDIRASDDLKKFEILGETNTGDQFIRRYDAQGNFEKQIPIEVN